MLDAGRLRARGRINCSGMEHLFEILIELAKTKGLTGVIGAVTTNKQHIQLHLEHR